MDVACRFARIVEILCRAVAARGAAGAFGAGNGALVLRLWSRLRRGAARFGVLASGAPPPRPRRRPVSAPPDTASRSSPDAAASRSSPDAPPLPRRAGWLLAPVPEAAAAAGLLRALLQDADTLALIAAEPRLGRILRPLCRALGLALPAELRLPSTPRRRVSGARSRVETRADVWARLWPALPTTPGQFHPPGRPPGYVPRPSTRDPPSSA